MFGLQSKSMAQLLCECSKQCSILQQSHKIYTKIDRPASNWRLIKGMFDCDAHIFFQAINPANTANYNHSDKDTGDDEKNIHTKTHVHTNSQTSQSKNDDEREDGSKGKDDLVLYFIVFAKPGIFLEDIEVFAVTMTRAIIFYMIIFSSFFIHLHIRIFNVVHCFFCCCFYSFFGLDNILNLNKLEYFVTKNAFYLSAHLYKVFCFTLAMTLLLNDIGGEFCFGFLNLCLTYPQKNVKLDVHHETIHSIYHTC